MTKRQVFYSFHYKPDNWRASQVRNIGVVEGNTPTSDNEWETVKSRGDGAIKKWINSQMEYRSCTVVLVGEKTANRKWINYEIEQSWKNNMGVVGICIHGLKNHYGVVSSQGRNPFDYVHSDGYTMSTMVKCYNPPGATSVLRYSWISRYLSEIIEEAIQIRENWRLR